MGKYLIILMLPERHDQLLHAVALEACVRHKCDL